MESISRIVNEHRANWLDSRLSQLAGKFAGIIQVEVDERETAPLVAALEGLRNTGLTVVVERGDGKLSTESKLTDQLTLLGLDRPGIVRDVSQALAEHSINVLELRTSIVRAAMTGEPMFDASATIEYDAETDLDRLVTDLEAISTELGIDIELGED